MFSKYYYYYCVVFVLYCVVLLHKYPLKRERRVLAGEFSPAFILQFVVFNKWTVLVISEYWTPRASDASVSEGGSMLLLLLPDMIYHNPIGVVRYVVVWCGTVVWCDIVLWCGVRG